MREMSFLPNEARSTRGWPLRQLSIRHRLMIAALLASTLPVLLVGVGFAVYDRNATRRELAAELVATAETLATMHAPALERDGGVALAAPLETLGNRPEILAVGVFDSDGRLVATYPEGAAGRAATLGTVGPEVRFETGWLEVTRPTVHAGVAAGAVTVRMGWDKLRERMWRVGVIAGVAMLVAAAGAGVLAARLQRVLLAPLGGVGGVARGVAREKNFSARAPRHGDEAVDEVIDGFNEMLEQLEERERALQQGRAELEQQIEMRTRELVREQTRFKGIFDAAPVGFTWMTRGDVKTRIVNPAHEEITGVPAAQGQQLARYRAATHPEDRARQDALHTRLLAGEFDRYTVEKRYVHPDGAVRWVALTVRLYRDPHGTDIHEINTVIDITERKRAAAELAEASKLLDAMMENTPDFIYFKDRESRFVRFSRAFIGRFGLDDQKTLRGKTDFDLFAAEHAKMAFADEQEIIRTGKAIVGQVERETYADGRVTWAMTTKMPWRDSDGAILGTFGISKDVTALKEAEAKAEATHKQLLETSRQAGMAEVATGVLHNVGNVLNSVNVSATLVAERVRHSKAANVEKLAALFSQNRDRLGDFMSKDPRGRMVPEYLGTLAEAIAAERKAVTGELDNLRKNIEHIKEIVAMQQAYARTSGVIETVSVPEMIEDALRINSGSLARHDVMTVRDYQARGVITTDKHKVIQILINLVRNAKYACDESGRTDKQIVVRATSDADGVKISIADNGVGIAPANLTRIFEHGFTTRQHGHGFGLHSGALAARELGGALTVHSDGTGKGATFTLELPYKLEKQKP